MKRNLLYLFLVILLSGNCKISYSQTTSPNILEIKTPSGGETFQVGSTQNVTWEYEGESQIVNIFLLSNKNLDPIGSADAASETYTFTVPIKVANDCKIYIGYNFSSGFKSATSNGTFAIIAGNAAPGAKISQPGNNAWLFAGSHYRIEWDAANVSTVTLEYSSDSGINWTILASGIPANNAAPNADYSGSYTWQIPMIYVADARIRIKNSVDGSLLDEVHFFITIGDGVQKVQKKSEEITLFPNPASNKLNIDFQGEIERVEIYSLTGIKMDEYKDANSTLSLEHLEKGMYILKIFTADQRVMTKTFIKE